MNKNIERRHCAAMHERFTHYEKKVDDEIKKIIDHGLILNDYNVRLSVLEDNMTLIKWIAGALFVTTLSTFAGIIVILLRLPK